MLGVPGAAQQGFTYALLAILALRCIAIARHGARKRANGTAPRPGYGSEPDLAPMGIGPAMTPAWAARSRPLPDEPRYGGAQFGDAGAGAGGSGEDFRVGGRMLGQGGAGRSHARDKLVRLHLVGLGEHKLIIHGRLVERREH